MYSHRNRSWRPVLTLGVSLLLAHCAEPAVGGTNTQSERDAKKPTWEPQGLSGGGAMFAPAISPVNPKLMMVNCDMSAAYISRDGGRNWGMIHHSQLTANTRGRPPKVRQAAAQARCRTRDTEPDRTSAKLPTPGCRKHL